MRIDDIIYITGGFVHFIVFCILFAKMLVEEAMDGDKISLVIGGVLSCISSILWPVSCFVYLVACLISYFCNIYKRKWSKRNG